jgi:hypothetical protein
MNVQFNKELLRNIYFWAITIPVILAIWSLSSAISSAEIKDQARRKIAALEKVNKSSREIRMMMRTSSGSGLARGDAIAFNGKKSAYECAKLARISDTQLTRGESASSKKLKDGSEMYRETYKLSKVRLLQVVKFIDHAEMNFSDVNCSTFSLSYSRAKSKDSWDATVNLEYLIR